MFLMRRQVYLDNNATTQVSPQVQRKSALVLKRYFGNPSSLYRTARDAARVLEESRAAVAGAVGAQPEEILFTGCASEANNQILKGLTALKFPNKKKIIASPLEHASVQTTLEYLRTQGVDVRYCPVQRTGELDYERLTALIEDDTFLVCCMRANNETGVINDLKRVVGIAAKRGVPVMSDCVQALGKIPVDVHELGVQYATFSAHKIHGPKGVGAVYIREGSPIVPLIHGGHQEHGYRAGTEGLHNIAAFGEACTGIAEMLSRMGKIATLRDMLVAELRKVKPDMRVNSPTGPCLPNTVSVTFPGVNNALFMAMLDYHGISVAAGSACNTQSDEPSHVLKAIGLSDEEARQTIRFSLSSETSRADTAYVTKVIRNFLGTRSFPVTMFSPSQLDENVIYDENTFILDIRFWHDRKILKGIPRSHEASFLFLQEYLHAIPRDKNIVVVCQAGLNSPISALMLHSRGYRNVGFLMGGVAGWRLVHRALYEKAAGKDVVKL